MRLVKFKYYFINYLITLIPSPVFRFYAKIKLKSYNDDDKTYIQDRVNYYNKIEFNFNVSKQATQIARFKKTGGTTYYLDLLKVVKSFPSKLYFDYLNGDIRHIPDSPTLLKSRPINGNNRNCVLLKLNAIRHFNFIKDPLTFSEKKNMSVWRGIGVQPHRKIVIEKYYDHPMCNIGQTKPNLDKPWVKEYISIDEQLNYKFILAIEGNDVATNLKWAMSSNSLVIMSKPKYETWFMEGRLESGVHYVEVKDDYSDLIEKMEYYTKHQKEAEQIIQNAHRWVKQFHNKNREFLISLLVAKKYFTKSKQI
ncbi:LPS A protein [Vibrio alfacsensis]|uniref:glycosyl transferase family 90 n=1 Tax=Vibrio alfacsensis TaxID=1074311 RepID=UPI001BEF877D|nr:glycosyl transferase family 90 [Vibrio alfacsensis]BBM65898.1 LPS A protein [Vibrio alfacsensis]